MSSLNLVPEDESEFLKDPEKYVYDAQKLGVYDAAMQQSCIYGYCLDDTVVLAEHNLYNIYRALRLYKAS